MCNSDKKWKKRNFIYFRWNNKYKKQEIIGFDVWLDSGVCIKGFKEFDEKAIEQAKKQIIEMIKKDECSWHWEEFRGEE